MDALAAEAKNRDPLRYASALYAPKDKRAALFALAVFASELAELPARVTNPALGEIRLQFWQDALDGKDGENLPAVAEIRVAVASKIWPLAAFRNMIEARRADLYDDRFGSVNDLEGYFGETRGAMFQLAALALGGGAEQGALAGHAGCVIGAAETLGQTRVAALLPDDLPGGIAAFGLRHGEACAPLLAGLPAPLRPAFLPLAVAQNNLARSAASRAPASPLATQFLLLKSALRGWPKR